MAPPPLPLRSVKKLLTCLTLLIEIIPFYLTLHQSKTTNKKKSPLTLTLMEKSSSNPTTHLKQKSRFTEPEVEAALQLIQLSGESDAYLQGHRLSISSGEILATISMKRKKEVVGDHDESQGSSTSDITSAVRRFFVPRFEAEGDDEDENSDVTGSRRRKWKKFRSVMELYEISS
ncbi:unnamed protein product [Lactuca saligna]|uniref:Uncharacterized protein n=1 Tax=Lactuca saligna TaxID=75948 RepID=A0AA35Z712_LACSI|nr:unnamed protein product [Lactuca saligna]